MKNLKRALSFALASVMLLGMMVVGAGAVEFNDADEIVNVDAVNTMAALGVIAGKDTGDFDPAGTITRGEMAKIICVMLNGGTDPNLGTSAAAYPDTANHWANSYIAYCSNLGIVAGDNHGNFNPDNTVTGTEAAKMLLVALGYDSDVFGFTGASWAISVNSQANRIKLYDDVNARADAPLSRDNAAQMAYNATSAYIMLSTHERQSNGEVNTSYVLSETTTFLNEYFQAMTFVGTYRGNSDSANLSTDGQVQVYGRLDTEDTGDRLATFPADLGIENIGEEVKVIFKDGRGGTDNRPDRNDTIYGVFNTENTEVYHLTKADMQDAGATDLGNGKIKFGDSTYDIASSVSVVTNYITGSPATYATATALQSALRSQAVDAIKFVANDEGEIFAAYVTEYKAGRVTAVTNSRVTISGLGAVDRDGNDIYEDVTRDDIVVYTKLYNATTADAYVTVTKAESAEGELTGYRQDGTPATYKNVVVDGTTYKVNAPAATLPDLTDDAITDPDVDGNIGDIVRVYLVGGMVAAVQTIEESDSTYALVTDVDTTGTLGSTMNPLRVALLYSDGSEETVVLHKDSTTDGNAPVDKDNIAKGDLVKFTTSGSQVKINTVTKAAAITARDDSGNATVWDESTKRLTYRGTDSAVAASNAVVFVKTSAGDDYSAYSLRSLKDIANTSGTGVSVAAMQNDDGLVVAAYVALEGRVGGSTADTLYGIVTGYVGTRVIDDDTFYRYTVAVGREEDLEVNVTTQGLTAGDLVMFDEATDAQYAAGVFTKLTAADAIAVRNYNDASKLLTYYNGTSRASVNDAFAGTDTVQSTTVDDDVVIRYVNADDNEAGDEIGVSAFDGTTGYANAAVLDIDDDGIFDVIFVETSGNVNLLGNTAFGVTDPVTLSVGAFGSISASSATGSENGAYTVTMPGATAPKGSTITITVATTGIDGANSAEEVTVTYSVGNTAGQTAVLTFTSAGASSQTFTVIAADNVTVTGFAVTNRTPTV